MKYKFEDINIGDEVYFDSTKLQNNHDLYWKVIHKYDQQEDLVVQLDTMGFQNLCWTINLSEVKYHTPMKK